MNQTELNKILDEHALWRKNKKQGRRAVLVGYDLHELDFSGADLQYAVFRESDLYGANLEDADLEDADLSDCDLSGAMLAHANLRNANLARAELTNADFTGTNCEGAIFTGTNRDMKQQQPVVPASDRDPHGNLRAKFEEFAKSLGVEIVSLKVKRTVVETIDLSP